MANIRFNRELKRLEIRLWYKMYGLKIRKREICYWNFDNRTCLARINTKTNLPTEVAGVYSVCYMLNIVQLSANYDFSYCIFSFFQLEMSCIVVLFHVLISVFSIVPLKKNKCEV